MALSRFYKPTNYEYMSQFVPKNLEIMDRGLQRAQAKQDKQVGKLDELHGMILKQEANKGWDTEVRDQIVGEVKSFSDEMANTDLTNPENFRKVNQFVQGMITDKRLADIKEGVALAKEGQKTKADYQGTEYGYLEELDPFSPAYNQYATQSGDDKKLSAEFLRGKTSWQKGVNAYETKEKMFANIASAGLETLHKLRDEDITVAYENGWTGVTGDKIRQVAGTEFDDYLRSPAGKQEAAVRIKRNPDISRKQLGDDMLLDFLQTGLKREGVKYQSGAAAAFNSAENIKRAKAKDEEIPASPVTQPGPTEQGGYKSGAHLIQEINRLNKSKDPKDLKRARELSATKDLLTTKAVQNLTQSEKDIVMATYDKIDKTDIKLMTAIVKESLLPTERALYGLVTKTPTTPEGKAEILRQMRTRIEQLDETTRNKYTKEALAKSKGLSGYGDIQDKMDKTFQQGTGLQQTDVMLDVSSQKAKIALGKASSTLFNDNNFDISTVTDLDAGTVFEQGTNPLNNLTNVSSYINPNSIKVRKGINGSKPGLVFKTTRIGDKSYEYVLTPKDFNPALRDFLASTVGEKEAKNLEREFNGSAYAPIGNDVDYTQTVDMGLDPSIVGAVSLVYSGNNKVAIKNRGLQGESPIKTTVSDVFNTIVSNDVDPNLVPNILNTWGLPEDAVVTNDNGTISLNKKYANSPAEFKDHIFARDYLAMKQAFAK